MSEPHLELMLADADATEALGSALARAYMGSGPASSDSLATSGGQRSSRGSGVQRGGSGNSAQGTGGGQRGAVLYLHGELGAGKTTCVRSLLRTLGVDGPIRSPTYTLVEAYQPRGITCVHVDLYRLQGPVDVEELGLRDFLDTECLLLVEWPEKGATALPPADLELTLTYFENSRRARLGAPTARGRRWLGILLHDTSLTPYVSNLT